MASICRPAKNAGLRWPLLLALTALFACGSYDDRLLAVTVQTSTEHDGGMSLSDSGVAPGDCNKMSGNVECRADNADAVCLDGVCRVVRCRDGFRDCDGEGDNGCEVPPTSPEHCGGCNIACALTHVEKHACDASSGIPHCVIDPSCDDDSDCDNAAGIGGCKPGFGDCDHNPSNGCEAMLNTLANCGACGKACAIEDAEASCQLGRCVFVGCAPGFGDCNDEGCVPLFADQENCGLCGNACPAEQPECAGGRCTALRCPAGTADCDGDRDNACETDLEDPETCGGCHVTCGPYPNAQPACADAQCSIGTCDEGMADCDSARDNGCETDLSDSTEHCGGCDNDCGTLPNVEQAACAAGSCTELQCKPGFGDCDGMVDNGCEQPLNTLDHCGGCGEICAPPHADASCDSGTCTITACEPGRDECNDQISDGCEAQLDSPDHCGSCDQVCPAGASCRNGGCGCGGAGDCPSGFECCGGSCIDTRGACVWWPCVPGTTRDYDHCGGCNVQCDRLACCG